MQQTMMFDTQESEVLIDITAEVKALVERSEVEHGIVSVYAQGSTAAIMVQESWEQSVQHDVITLLRQLVPQGVWQHDTQEANGAAHLKAGLVGSSETIPIMSGALDLLSWQKIYLCEFDGPRSQRRVVCTVIGD
ncbi:YjbQ family protein [Ectothiorhodospiraceae bacterium BW-2]|nr:YjbQ family protein [Ectothiorhodospiraceae bacterium BW-2]